MDILEKVLRETLDKLDKTNEVSVSDVINLEDTVSAINPDYKGFITIGCPLHKFTTIPTSTNVDVVKLSTRTLLDNELNIKKTLNKNSFEVKYETIVAWKELFVDMEYYVTTISKIPPDVIKQLANFKYVAHLEEDTFKDMGNDIPFMDALANTDLKEIFKVEDIIDNFEVDRSTNDYIYGLIKPFYDISSDIDTTYDVNLYIEKYLTGVLLRRPDDIILPYVSAGYKLTVRDIVVIYSKTEFILKCLDVIISRLRTILSIMMSSYFILDEFSYPDDRPEYKDIRNTYSTLSERKDVLDMLESPDDTNITFRILGEIFNKESI